MGWTTGAGGATPGMRRPVRTITDPPTPSRKMRFGLPTSPAPSGVTVAAFNPRPVARIAAAASRTTSFDVRRRFSSDRSKCSSETSKPRTRGSRTRSAWSKSSWPVWSPSHTTILRSRVTGSQGSTNGASRATHLRRRLRPASPGLTRLHRSTGPRVRCPASLERARTARHRARPAGT